jgi:hypothetical protein
MMQEAMIGCIDDNDGESSADLGGGSPSSNDCNKRMRSTGQCSRSPLSNSSSSSSSNSANNKSNAGRRSSERNNGSDLSDGHLCHQKVSRTRDWQKRL